MIIIPSNKSAINAIIIDGPAGRSASNDRCRGGEGTLIGNTNTYGYTMADTGGDPSYAYCSYYECNATGDACSIDDGYALFLSLFFLLPV